MGAMKDPYDTLLAIRLDEDYSPTLASRFPAPSLKPTIRMARRRRGRCGWSETSGCAGSRRRNCSARRRMDAGSLERGWRKDVRCGFLRLSDLQGSLERIYYGHSGGEIPLEVLFPPAVDRDDVPARLLGCRHRGP
jgi:hypothetical protein